MDVLCPIINHLLLKLLVFYIHKVSITVFLVMGILTVNLSYNISATGSILTNSTQISISSNTSNNVSVVLTCSANLTSDDSLIHNQQFMWSGPGITNHTTTGQSSSITLLLGTQSSEIKCTATLGTSSISTTVNTTHTIECKYVHTCTYIPLFLALSKYLLIFRRYILTINILFSVPQVAVTITKSRSGPVYAGTEFVLIADISLSGVNGNISLNITWNRRNKVIVGDSRITMSPVRGSGDNYTASLTYSPITISDSGQITANVTVTVSSLNTYFTAIETEFLNVQGMHTCTNNRLIIRDCT